MNRLLPFLLLIVSAAGLADTGTYRVEVIIFRNLDVLVEATTSEGLRSFSHLPGLEEVVQADPLPDDTVDELPAEALDEILEVYRDDLPEDLQVVTQKSTRMDGVWRRLRSSQGYRPLLYSAWEQNRVNYYPPMRIHNESIIDTQLRPPTQIMVADLTAEDPLGAYRSTFYQLDGSVQLRRSRFLHLFLDIEYRVENQPHETMTDSTTGHDVYTLQQNRQIRTGRVQYFDTPYFGALVLVSAIAAK